MEKIYKKIEEYLKKNFPKKKIVLRRGLLRKETEIWGFNSMMILVQEDGDVIYYKPLFQSKK